MKTPWTTLAALALLAGTSWGQTYDLRGTERGQALTGRAAVDLAAQPPRLEIAVAGRRPLALGGEALGADAYRFRRPAAFGLADLFRRGGTEVIAAGLNLRAGPGEDFPVVGEAAFGQRIDVVAGHGDWRQVRLADGSLAWAHGGYLREQGGVSGTTILLKRLSADRLEGVIQVDGRETGRFALTREAAAEAPVTDQIPPTSATPPATQPATPPATPAPAERRALLVHSWAHSDLDQRAFRTYARDLATYYRNKGYAGADVVQGDTYLSVIEALEGAAAAGRPYHRLVMIGHGGWDGPILGSSEPFELRQVSGKQNVELYRRFVAAVQAGTTPDAAIFSSSCHAAGSNVYERAEESSPRYNWVHDLARRTGRTVAGPAGYTSTEYTYRAVRMALEGEGTAIQETHVASAAGLRIVMPGGTVAGAQLRPIPPIAQLPEAAPPAEAPAETEPAERVPHPDAVRPSPVRPFLDLRLGE